MPSRPTVARTREQSASLNDSLHSDVVLSSWLRVAHCCSTLLGAKPPGPYLCGDKECSRAGVKVEYRWLENSQFDDCLLAIAGSSKRKLRQVGHTGSRSAERLW